MGIAKGITKRWAWLAISALVVVSWFGDRGEIESHWRRLKALAVGARSLAADSRLEADLGRGIGEAQSLKLELDQLAGEQDQDRASLARITSAMPSSDVARENAELARQGLEYCVAIRERRQSVLRSELERAVNRVNAIRQERLGRHVTELRADMVELADSVGQFSDTPRTAISQQWTLLMDGRTTSLRECFTESARDRVTDDLVRVARLIWRRQGASELADEVELSADGQRCVVRTQDGAELTRMVLHKGRWLSERVWFE